MFRWLIVCWVVAVFPIWAWSDDLDRVLGSGRLRHLAIPYANFVTGSGDGLDVELIQLFARDLGVRYEGVLSSWKTGIGDLTGTDPLTGKSVPVKGDILASGMTVLDWRKQFVLFSRPTFPSQVWVVARADHGVAPITPGRDLNADILQVKALLAGQDVMGVENTSLDPRLYGLEAAGARLLYYKGCLNELVPAVMNKDAGMILMDVPDALMGLEKWQGKIKVIGPISPRQKMAAAMAKSSPELKKAFDGFLTQLIARGQYRKLVEKYYPDFQMVYPDFFGPMGQAGEKIE